MTLFATADSVTPAHLDAICPRPLEEDASLDPKVWEPPLVVAPDVRRALRTEPGALVRFEKLPVSYKRIRLGFIEGARGRPEIFAMRLRYSVRMTAHGKRYGMVRS